MSSLLTRNSFQSFASFSETGDKKLIKILYCFFYILVSYPGTGFHLNVGVAQATSIPICSMKLKWKTTVFKLYRNKYICHIIFFPTFTMT